MERKEAIRSAYRLTGGNNFYDGMITCSTLSGKAVCRLVWDMNKAENDAYLEKALSGIPEHFSGKMCIRDRSCIDRLWRKGQRKQKSLKGTCQLFERFPLP